MISSLKIFLIMSCFTFLVLWSRFTLSWADTPVSSVSQEYKITQKTVQKAETQPSVWVFIPDGAEQCVHDSGLSLQEGREKLVKAGILVLDAKKGRDLQVHAAVCGGPADSVNLFLIPKMHLSLALTLGYKLANHFNNLNH